MKLAGLYIMAVLYIAAGINHFIKPQGYVKIMPPWLPWHTELVYVSGIFEVLLGVLLIPAYTRVWAAWALIVLLIAVFPANVQMMLNYHHRQLPGFWVTVVRLPLQAVLIWWAWLYTR